MAAPRQQHQEQLHELAGGYNAVHPAQLFNLAAALLRVVGSLVFVEILLGVGVEGRANPRRCPTRKFWRGFRFFWREEAKKKKDIFNELVHKD